MKKVLALLVFLGGGAVLGWQVYQKASASLKPPARVARSGGVAVEVAAVEKATVREAELFRGTLLARSQFIIAPKIAGRLEKLLVDVADKVTRGQRLAVLEDEEYRRQEDQAKAELAVAQANVGDARSALDVAKREYDRAQALRRKGIVSEAELERADAQLKAAEAKQEVALAQVTQMGAALKAAQVRLSYTEIVASWQDEPPARLVGERFVDAGAMLKANDPIVSILDISVLKAVVHVIERDYSKVRVGQAVAIATDAFPGRTFPGKIARVAPLLKETSRQARVEIEVTNPAPEWPLRPGMFIRAHVEFARHENVTVVPLSSVVKRNGQPGVFLADPKDSKARFVPIRPGFVEGGRTEVLTPALSGWVVTLGQHLLEDGASVRLPEGPAPAPKRDGRSEKRGDR